VLFLVLLKTLDDTNNIMTKLKIDSSYSFSEDINEYSIHDISDINFVSDKKYKYLVKDDPEKGLW
jgi:hypothetical protein